MLAGQGDRQVQGARVNPLVRTASLAELEAAEPSSPENLTAFNESMLAGHIRRAWQVNKLFKEKTALRLLRSLRARRGIYSQNEIAQMSQSGGLNYVWVDLTETKCRAASAWLREVLMPVSGLPFDLRPSPMPDLPLEMKQAIVQKAAAKAQQAMLQMQQAGGGVPSLDEFRNMASEIGESLRDDVQAQYEVKARRAAERMYKRVKDSMVEGGWHRAIDAFIEDFVTYPAAILKGPYYARKRRLEWLPGWRVGVNNAPVQMWGTVSPFDAFPAPYATTCQEGDFIERIRYTRRELYDCIGLEDYREDQIRAALKDYSNGHLEAWLWTEAERQRLEQDTYYSWLSPRGVIDALHYWGSVPGFVLMSWQVAGWEDLDPVREYEVDAILIGPYVVRCALNRSPLGQRPYWNASYDQVPNAFWGRSVPDLAETCQKMVNAAASAMADNMGHACLTGDTVVYKEPRNANKRSRAKREVTLNQLWAARNAHRSGLRRTWIRSLDEATGQFVANRIVDIVDNGVRPVYRVRTAHGYSIKATMNHRFLGEDGEYRALERFAVGDLMAVNGSAGHRDFDRIESIEYVGEERVFDLCMQAPLHNFVANGIVSHNSGPMVWVHVDRFADGERSVDVFPFRVWQMKSAPDQGVNPGVGFFQADDRSAALMAVIDRWELKADDATGIPRYTYGNERVGGAASTLGGLSLLMNNAAKGLRRAIGNIDLGVIQPTATMSYVYHMLWDPDPTIKGDCYVEPSGAMSMLVKETHTQALISALDRTANPIDMQIIGVAGRAQLWRQTFEALEIPTEGVIPTDDEIQQRMAQEMQAQQEQAQAQAQAEERARQEEIERQLAIERERSRLRMAEKEREIEAESERLGAEIAARMKLADKARPRSVRLRYDDKGDVLGAEAD